MDFDIDNIWFSMCSVPNTINAATTNDTQHTSDMCTHECQMTMSFGCRCCSVCQINLMQTTNIAWNDSKICACDCADSEASIWYCILSNILNNCMNTKSNDMYIVRKRRVYTHACVCIMPENRIQTESCLSFKCRFCSLLAYIAF